MNFTEITHLLKLKEVDRAIPVHERAESSAEHTWACLMLADYFFSQHEFALNKQHVFDLLLYHDVVEIECGDTDFMDEIGLADKHERERSAMQILQHKLPAPLGEKFQMLFNEWVAYTTPESQFAHAIDKIEPMLHLLDYKEEWKKRKLTEAFVRKKKEHAMVAFPEIHRFFEELIVFLKGNDYFVDE